MAVVLLDRFKTILGRAAAFRPPKNAVQYLKAMVWLGASGMCAIVLGLGAVFLYLDPQIPATETFTNYQFETPLRVFDEDQRLIAEFGDRRLIPISIDDVPPLYLSGLLGTEDKRFYGHFGIDLISLTNDTVSLLTSDVRTGASTITMQLAKIVSFTLDQTFIRKFKEMLLALKIERQLEKREILELYVNIVPFGKRAYGLQAAAHTYYGKPVDELNLAQLAMLAGITKKPEGGNPINGPEWALDRRNLVLRRMFEQNAIDQAAFETARNAPITARVFQLEVDLPSPYPAEQVRQELVGHFGTGIYSGYEVTTTIDVDLQAAAQRAVRQGLFDYDVRHGYRGPAGQLDLAEFEGDPDAILTRLREFEPVSGLEPGVVVFVDEQAIDVMLRNGDVAHVPWEGLRWARRFIDEDTRGPSLKTAGDAFAAGDVIRLLKTDTGWAVRQVPEIQGALIALDPRTGEIKALVGGFNFYRNQFNHALQAFRQPGSGFKPVLYSAALDEGVTPATIFLDAPLVFDDENLETTYRPRNDSGTFKGPTRLREALFRSVNLVSIRVLLEVGTKPVIDHAANLGLDVSTFPRNTQLAIGGGTMTVRPIDMTRTYATFANGGFAITPHLVKEVRKLDGSIVLHPEYPLVCDDCGEGQSAVRVLDERNAFIIQSMLRDVVKRGTGRKALALGREDLAGKTGTTNEAADTWFNGFHPHLVATTWVGFSDLTPIGSREYGSTTPLEIWVDFMEHALDGVPTINPPLPDGVVSVRIDLGTGRFAGANSKNTAFEFFLAENLPPGHSSRPRTRQRTVRPEDIF